MSIIIGVLIFIFPFIFGYIVGYVYGKGYEDRKWVKNHKTFEKSQKITDETSPLFKSPNKPFGEENKEINIDEPQINYDMFKDGTWEIYMYKPYTKTLEDLLKQALEDEDFEKAAELRDKIKKRDE